MEEVKEEVVCVNKHKMIFIPHQFIQTPRLEVCFGKFLGCRSTSERLHPTSKSARLEVRMEVAAGEEGSSKSHLAGLFPVCIARRLPHLYFPQCFVLCCCQTPYMVDQKHQFRLYVNILDRSDRYGGLQLPHYWLARGRG